MKVAALMVAMLLSGCALTVRPLSRRWDGATKPACTSSWAPVAGDGALAFASAAVGAVSLADYSQHRDNQAAQNLTIGGFVVAAVFFAAAAVSEERVTDCRTAQIAWQSTAALRAKAARAAPAPAFFCASSAASPGVGLCARQQPVCVQARNAAVGAVPDLAVCAAASSAWCFGAGDAERCAATLQACTEQRARAGDGAGECHEVR